MSDGALDGLVAVVTGAGRGIGRAEAVQLAAEGASVVVNDVGVGWDGSGGDARVADDVVAEIRDAGGRAAANYDDISTWDGAGRVIEQAVEAFRSVDIVVNNAGFLRDRWLVNLGQADWDAVLNVHLRGHAAMTHHACVHWRERSLDGEDVAGRIVNTSSEAAMQGLIGQANYAAAKAGIIALTVVTANEMTEHGVTANVITPRARTRMITESFGADVMQPAPGAFDEFAPENVAPLVAFLASPAAAGITGRCFAVSGGVVQLYSGWQVEATITTDGRWSTASLAAELPALLATPVDAR